jgi:membrane protein YqaA with SNARE-associated domain
MAQCLQAHEATYCKVLYVGVYMRTSATNTRGAIVTYYLGRTMAQAVSRRPLTAEARLNLFGIYGG